MQVTSTLTNLFDWFRCNMDDKKKYDLLFYKKLNDI